MSLFNPFPGLRPFRQSETHLFFGRSEHIDELLAELGRSRLVAVMGASGSGKSSLVAAGLLPALLGGLSTHLGTSWRIANFRPGGNPIRNLAEALAAPDDSGEPGPNGDIGVDQVEATLRRSGLGLVDVVERDLHLEDNRLLVIVDQFEELFRFQGVTTGTRPDDSAEFVQLLIEATQDHDGRVDVILTMRSDYLGDCSQFSQLPEAINKGLYLIPRLTRSQMREAITGPVAVGGGTITPRLVQRLLNDARSDPDILPVVQHALMRTWDLWVAEGATSQPIDLEDYEAGGGLDAALARHADEAYYELSDDPSRRIAELMFKRLTEVDVDGREGRSPTPLGELAAVCGTTPDTISQVIAEFADKGRSFLHVSKDGVVDISHESLIRQWPRLRGWVREEVGSRDVYRRLANAADRWRRGEAALLRDPDLQVAINWWTTNQPTKAWAERYDPAFEQAVDYLDRSRNASTRRRILTWGGVAALGVLAVLFGLLTVRANRAEDEAQHQERLAVARQLAAVSAERGPALRTQSLLSAIEAVRTTEEDEVRLPEAEEALRLAMHDPLGLRLPSEPGQVGHHDEIDALAFSPDGEWLATAGRDDAVMLWEMGNPDRAPVTLDGHTDDVVDLAFSPDGRWLATGGNDDMAMLWDMENLEIEPVPLPGHDENVTEVEFNDDGTLVAAASLDGTIRLWHVDRPDTGPRVLDHGATFVLTMEFSPNGRWLASGSGEGLGRLWDLEDLDSDPRLLRGHTDDLVTLDFSPDSQTLATGSQDGTVRVWNSNRPGAPLVLEHGDPVLALAFSADRRWLVTGAEDNRAQLWDLRNLSLSSTPSVVLAHSGPVQEVAVSADDRWVVTGGQSDAVRLFRLDALADSPIVLAGPVTALGLSDDGERLAIGSDEGSARLWDLGELSTRPTVFIHDADVTALAFSPNNSQLATGMSDNTAQLWTVGDPDSEPVTLETDPVEGLEMSRVETLAFSPDGAWLVTGSGDKRIRWWDLRSSVPDLSHTQELTSGVNALAFSPDGSWLAVGVQAEVVLLWSVDHEVFTELVGHSDYVKSVAFSPDGSVLATGSLDGEIRLWDPRDLEADSQVLGSHDESVTTLAFSPDGTQLASGSSDRQVRLWRLASGTGIVLPVGSRINGVAYRPDGRLLAVAADSAQLWDLSAPNPEMSFANPTVLGDHPQQVNAVAFTSDGNLLATGSADDTARLWLQLDALVDLGCENVGRNFTREEWDAIGSGEPPVTCEQWSDQ